MIPAQVIDRDIDGDRILLVRAAIGAIVCVLLFTALTALGRGTFSNRIEVSALVDNAGGALSAGSDVKSSGVIIGHVTELSRAGDKVRIDMVIDGDQAAALPADVTARVLPATAFGTTFVDLVATGDGGHLAHGATIRQAADGETLELQDALDGADRVLGAVSPAELAATLAAISTALDGRGELIGATLERTDAYLARLEPHVPVLKEDLALAAQYLGMLQDVAPLLFDTVRDSSPALRTLTEKRAGIEASLLGATSLTQMTDEFLMANRAELIQAIDDTARTFAALYDFRAGFPVGFRAFANFASKASEGLVDGPWLDTDVYIKTGEDAPYTAADCPRFGTAIGANCPEAQ